MPHVYTCSDPNHTIYAGIDSSENDLLARYCWPNDILFNVSNLSSGHIYLRCPVDAIDLELFGKVSSASDFFKHLKIQINVLDECLHLTKLSCIEGSKRDSVGVDITPWLNVEQVKGTKAGTIHLKNMQFVTMLNVTCSNKVKKTSSKRGKRNKKGDTFADEKQPDSNSDDERVAYNMRGSRQKRFTKKLWKKKLTALEKTKRVVHTKNVETYLMEQQRQRNVVLNSKREMAEKKAKAQQEKDRLRKKKEEDARHYVGVFEESEMNSNANMTEEFEDSFM